VRGFWLCSTCNHHIPHCADIEEHLAVRCAELAAPHDHDERGACAPAPSPERMAEAVRGRLAQSGSEGQQ